MSLSPVDLQTKKTYDIRLLLPLVSQPPQGNSFLSFRMRLDLRVQIREAKCPILLELIITMQKECSYDRCKRISVTEKYYST